MSAAISCRGEVGKVVCVDCPIRDISGRYWSGNRVDTDEPVYTAYKLKGFLIEYAAKRHNGEPPEEYAAPPADEMVENIHSGVITLRDGGTLIEPADSGAFLNAEVPSELVVDRSNGDDVVQTPSSSEAQAVAACLAQIAAGTCISYLPPAYR